MGTLPAAKETPGKNAMAESSRICLCIDILIKKTPTD
jgi:hypothetical protein